MSSLLTLMMYVIVYASFTIDPAIPQVSEQDMSTSTHPTENITENIYNNAEDTKRSSNASMEADAQNRIIVSDNNLTSWTDSANRSFEPIAKEEQGFSNTAMKLNNVSDKYLRTWTHSAVDVITDNPSGHSPNDEYISSNISIETTTENNTKHDITRTKPTTHSDEQLRNIITWTVAVVATSLVAVFGLIGNCISVCVLTSPRMKSSNSVILVFLAGFDSLILLRHILFVTIKNILSLSLTTERLIDIYLLPAGVIYRPIENIAYFGSLYTTIILTLERLLVVMFPLRAITLCTIKHASVCGVIILTMSVIFNLPKFILVTINTEKDAITNLTKFVVVTKFSYELNLFHFVMRKYVEVIFLVAIPALCLVVFNSCIIFKLYRRSRIFKTKSSSVSGRQSGVTDRITAMTMAITATFCVNLIMVNIDRDLCFFEVGSKKELSKMCYGFHLATDFIYTFNSAVNFVYYCLFGSKFRSVLFSVCSRRVTKRQPSLSTITQEPSVIQQQ